MISNLTWILIFLSVCGIMAASPKRALDCRKYVFAPPCRGVASKRNFQGAENYDTPPLFEEERSEIGKNNQQLLRSIYSDLAFLGEDENDGQSGISRRRATDFANPGKSFQGRRKDSLKVYESRSSRERDRSSASEYGNLRSIPSVLHFSRV